VSLDKSHWFQASKVIGLFPEGTTRSMRGGDAAPAGPRDAGELTFKVARDTPNAGAWTDGPSSGRGPWASRNVGDSERDDSGVGSTTSDDDSSDEVQTRVMTPPGQAHPSENQTDEPTTRVETVPRPIADHFEPSSQLRREPDGLARRAVRVSVVVGELALRVLRSTAIAMILIAGWVIRSGYGLIRRRRVGRTALESRLASSLRTRSRASTEVDGSARSAPRAEPLPELFGRYRIVKLLGRGGMGSVYLARDAQLDRSVALKVPHFSSGDGPEVLERFYREARAAATIEHPNVCPIYDVGAIDGHHYVSMAFVDGRPLSDLVEADKRLSQREAAILVRKVALAMAEAHRRGIIHRDIKPANIMINTRREPVIMDFGLARRSSRKEGRLTRSGAIVGTPAYMPPEQVQGDPDAIGPACDIYSLGCVLYEILTGRLPFEGSAIAVLGQVLTQDPPPPSTFRADLDTQLEAICRKAMARKVEDRYASMVELANALGRFLKSGTPAAAGDAEPGDADISWSEFFALPPRKAPGAALSDRPAGSTVRNTPVTIWPWVAIAAVLVAALVFLATRERPTRVEIQQLTGIQVENQTINNYYLDGKPVTAKQLEGPIALMTGEHELRLTFADGTEERRTFTVERSDEKQKVDVNRPDVGASVDVRPLAVALRSEHPRLRKNAAERLMQLNDKSAVPDLIKRVADGRWVVDDYIGPRLFYSPNDYDPIGGGKSAALEALRKLAPARVDDALSKAMKSPNPHVAAWAASLYGRAPATSPDPAAPPTKEQKPG
jgi:predicted Ser/Thr protein kinase